MQHSFWIYRRRPREESVEISVNSSKREYQTLPHFLRGSWPGLKLRIVPGEGGGLKVTILANQPHAAIERFLNDCLSRRNVDEPTAYLTMERTR